MPAAHSADGESFPGFTELESMTCASCGVVFAIPEHMASERRQTGEVFYCPSGHTLTFHSKFQELRQQLDRERRRSGRLAAERDQIEARLGALGGGRTMWRVRVRALLRRPRARAELPSLAE